MSQYISTFITGFQEVVNDSLKKQLNGVKVKLLLDGLVFYETDTRFHNINTIRFFNNNYYVLKYFEKVKNNSVEYMIHSILKNPNSITNIPREIASGATSFRIMISKENQTISANKDLLVQVERFFAYRLGLKVNRTLSDIEIWFLLRSEGIGFVGIRTRKKDNHDRSLAKGELRPELANLLCWVSEPNKTDIFLDPFAGSGAIPYERAKSFHYQKIIASDKDEVIFTKLNRRFQKLKNKIVLGKWNALHLTTITDNSIDKIVTDPPWGLFSYQDIDLKVFYKSMLKEFARIIKKDGLLVILTAQKELFEKLLEEYPELKLIKKFNVLVSGKKAEIFKIKKTR